jgi:putative ABC transport system ATP-binding protein
MDCSKLRPRPGPSIRVEDLEMIYERGPDQIRALDKISLQIPSGQFLVVRGRSGSGKTTLLHSMAGLRKVTAGHVFIDGVDIQSLAVNQADRFRRLNIGLIFQFFNLIPSLTVEMNIALPLLLENRKLPDLMGRIEDLMDLLEIGHRRNHEPHQLSGGEMQRVAIARALIINPKLILADEPTGNLDSAASHEIFALLQQLAQERTVTTIVMTHELDATSYADRVLVLSDGRVVEDTELSEPSE